MTNENREENKKKLVYISGPYRSVPGLSTVVDNVWRARACAMKYWEKGYTVFCPHLNSAFMDGIIPDAEFLEADIVILRRCDIIVMMEGWGASIGAIKEHEEAEKSGIQIIYEGRKHL